MPPRAAPAWHAVCILILVAGYASLVRGAVYPGPYDYDEADYMSAARESWWRQANDDPSLSLAQFTRLGRAAKADGSAAKASGRADLSELIRASNDVVFYRHWHGPLIAYWLSALKRAGLEETGMRRAGFLFPLLGALLIYAFGERLFGGSLGVMTGFLGAAFYLWSYAVVRSNELAPHQMFAVFCLCALLLVARFIQTGRRIYWRLAIAAAALAFCALEVALMLLAALACIAWLERRNLRWNLRRVAISKLLFIACVAGLWPAAIYKLSFLKAYAFMGYLALYRKAAWGAVTFGSVWRHRLLGFPVEWLLIAAALAIFARSRELPGRRFLYPLPLFAALMLLAVLRVNADMPRYLLPFEPALLAFAGFVLAAALSRVRAPARTLAVAALAAALYVNTAWQNHMHPVIPDSRPWDALAFIRAHDLNTAAMLIPAGDVPTIHYYFPQTHLRSYAGQQPSPGDFAGRFFAAILYPGAPLRFELQ